MAKSTIFFLLGIASASATYLQPPGHSFKLQTAATHMIVWPKSGHQNRNNEFLVYYSGSQGDNKFTAEKTDNGCFILRSASNPSYAVVPQYGTAKNNRRLVFYRNTNTNSLKTCCCHVFESSANNEFVIKHTKTGLYVHPQGGFAKKAGTGVVYYQGSPGHRGAFIATGFTSLSAPPPPPPPPPVTSFSSSSATAINCPNCGCKTQFTNEQAQRMLDIHNKMRCAVGHAPLKWNCKLMCQAQCGTKAHGADRCVSKHAWETVYGHNFRAWHNDLQIPAQENMATWHGIEGAAWAWFAEYKFGQPLCGSRRGHFQGIIWKDTTEMACGVCPKTTDRGVPLTVCQYANPEPRKYNCAKSKGQLVMPTEASMKRCGLLSTAQTYRNDEKCSWSKRPGDWMSRKCRAGKKPSDFAYHQWYDADHHVQLTEFAKKVSTPFWLVTSFAGVAMLVGGVLILRRRQRQHELISSAGKRQIMLDIEESE
eukprot:TRINITY_DN109466_c0_g1_i1.p1 TRINITY_DN109466_c0_g1~~TRINITY_DN109466_c0_g1_i1.p1  ORF type:complete len:494 (-),score=61.95 TRINITY_DN109466_c0_g1_i1:423-1862(-)